MKLDSITYQGPEIDDPAILDCLPSSVSNLLSQINGFILHNGAFHFRGAVKSPEWHSLRKIWKEDENLSDLYPSLSEEDIPFGQDCFGDQFFLRDKEVWVLYSET